MQEVSDMSTKSTIGNHFAFVQWNFLQRHKTDRAVNTTPIIFKHLPSVYRTHVKGIVYRKGQNGLWRHSISWHLGRDTCILLSLCNLLGEGCGLPTHQILQTPGPCLDQTLWPRASRRSCTVKRQQSLMGKLGTCKNGSVKMTWHSLSHFPGKEGEGNASWIKSLAFPSYVSIPIQSFPFHLSPSRLHTPCSPGTFCSLCQHRHICVLLHPLAYKNESPLLPEESNVLRENRSFRENLACSS